MWIPIWVTTMTHIWGWCWSWRFFPMQLLDGLMGGVMVSDRLP